MLGDRVGSMWHVQIQGFARLHAKEAERPGVDENRSVTRAIRLLPRSAATAAAAAGCWLNFMTLPARCCCCGGCGGARLIWASALLTMWAERPACLATGPLLLLEGG